MANHIKSRLTPKVNYKPVNTKPTKYTKQNNLRNTDTEMPKWTRDMAKNSGHRHGEVMAKNYFLYIFIGYLYGKKI